MNVAFLVRSMEDSSSRYRALQYLPSLKEKGVDVSVLTRQRRWRDKLKLYNALDQYDIVVIYRKLFTPAEFWYIRRKARKIVFDLDDAVMFRSSGSTPSTSFSRRLRFSYMMKRVDAVIAGNEFLKAEVLRYNDKVAVIPTTIDLSRYSMKEDTDRERDLTIGWMGSNSTLEYLKPIVPAIEKIHRKHPRIRFKIVCDNFLDNMNVPVIKKKWTFKDEEGDLRSFDIGIMPLEDDLWSRGKCALKILQYYGVGLPVVCSPVGINRDIVQDGVNGFWARDQKEWEERLEALIHDEGLRRQMGSRGRRTVEEEYSLEVNAPRLFSVLNEVMERGRVNRVMGKAVAGPPAEALPFREVKKRVSVMSNDGPCSFRAISQGEIRGRIREDLCDLLPPHFFEDPVPSVLAGDTRVIRESRLRWAGIVSLPNGTRLFLKRDRSKGRWEYIKFLFLPSRGRSEWWTATRLEERGVRIPKPMGWMERRIGGLVRESYYISEAIGSGITCLDEAAPLTDRAAIVELARAVRKILDAALFHRDFHAGNFLWHETSVVLTDLHKARIVRQLSLRRQLWMISHLLHSLRFRWAREQETAFLEACFEGRISSEREIEGYLQRIHLWMDRLQKRQWRSRTKRCLKQSTEFTVETEGGETFYRRREVSLDCLREVIRGHRCIAMEKPSSLLKNSPRVVVSLVEVEEAKVCVKQFIYSTLGARIKECFRREKGLRAWVAANGLRARGIPGLKLLAFVKQRGRLEGREGFLVMKALENGQEMDRYLVKGFEDEITKRRFIRTFAQWLSRMHEKGVYHQDMKTCNIWVSEIGTDWNFTLLDLEDVALDETVDDKKLFRTCLQLNTSIPGRITRTDRLRFLRQYQACRPVSIEMKKWVKEMADETRRRGILYVAPWGVVKEEGGRGR